MRLPLLALVLLAAAPLAQTHPSVFTSPEEAAAVRAARGTTALLDATLADLEATMAAALAAPMDVPPPGEAGGAAHERHKQNYREMYAAGLLYPVTRERRYADFVRDLLLRYADLYPTLGPHPRSENQVPGKLFHQLLNENVWLVHTIIGYDGVADALTPAERARIERDVFRPMVSWFVNEGASEMNRIHNHGTWTVAAVGLAGYVLGEPDWVEMALYGTDRSGTGGFLRQLDELFSPDGYYMEGPYYARYALWPFFYFAEAVERREPARGIYAYRDGILRKALYATVQTAWPDGRLPALNDASRSMDVADAGVVLGTDLVYARYAPDPALLGVARFQGAVVATGAGLAVSRAVDAAHAAGRLPAMTWPSVEFRDGADGTRGGLGILRAGTGADQTVLLMKYGVHGLGHGHFDKLSVALYDHGRDVLRDYGFARFVNVEPKFGGRYLPENDTWAKQTLAHNTVVVDGQSQNDGDRRAADAMHAERHFFDGDGADGVQAMSATATGYYPGVDMQRTVLLVEDDAFEWPVVIDLYRLSSDAEHQYDYPLHVSGTPTAASVAWTAHTDVLRPMGTAAGYQHVWETARAVTDDAVQVTWLDGGRYYSATTSAAPGTEVRLGRTGAGDPSFNLLSEPLLVLRRRAADHLFATVLEPHGLFDEARERSVQARSRVASVRVLGSDDAASVVEVAAHDGPRWHVLVANGPAPDGAHSATFGGTTFRWTGPAAVRRAD